MGNLLVENKNLINEYQPTPKAFYDTEGLLLESDGKNIKLEKTIDKKTVQYDIRLKAKIDGKIGEMVKVDKENIVDIKIEEKEEVEKEDRGPRNIADILKKLGLEYTEENVRMIEQLMRSGITISQDSVDSYKKSKEYLGKITDKMDTDLLVKLMDQGVDLENESLQNVAEALDRIKDERDPFSLKKFLKIDKDLGYKEAEEISKEIYGQRMGKDVYDTIIALDKEGIEITKENIDRTIDAMKKLYDLRDLENHTYVKVLEGEEEFTIDNLFKMKNSYTKGSIEGGSKGEVFESFTVAREADITSLRQVLADLGIEDSMDNLSILREFIVNNMTMDRESYDKLISMKEDLGKLKDLLSHRKLASFLDKGIDPTKEDIHELVEVLENDGGEIDPVEKKEVEKVLRDLESLGTIEDRDLLQLLKEGEDFNLSSIREIIDTNMERKISLEYKTLDLSKNITSIFTSLGSDLSSQVISLAREQHNLPSLDNLYNSHMEVKEGKEVIAPIEKTEENFIFQEYLRARESLTTNMIKESIKDGKVLEHMPLDEVNNYIDKKVKRYKEVEGFAKGIESIRGGEEKLLPMIMKNNLSMTLKEIKDINEFLNGQRGISQTIRSITDRENKRYKEEYKEEIKLVQKKLSSSIRRGDERAKKDYKDLVNLMDNPRESGSQGDESRSWEREGKDYMEIQQKLSRKDIVLQFPIDASKGYKDLSIIIPNGVEGIDRNNMDFVVSLETENLGLVTMDLRIVGREVEVNLQEGKESIRDNMEVLEEALGRLGYRMKEKGEPMVI